MSNLTRGLAHVRRLSGLLVLASATAIPQGEAWAQDLFGPRSTLGPFAVQAILPVTGLTALDGDVAVVASEGVVHVFERDPASDEWREAEPLPAGDTVPGFGRSLAIDDDTAIVGAEGAAYVFERRRNGWRRVATLAPEGRPAGFGISVGIDGGVAIVGAPGSQAADEPGAAYIFARRGASHVWTEAATLGSGHFMFGGAVGVSGDIAVVGETAVAGALHVFERVAGERDRWEHVTGLVPRFSRLRSVAATGDTAILGYMVPSSAASCLADFFMRDEAGPGEWGRAAGTAFFECTGGVHHVDADGDRAILAGEFELHIHARNQRARVTFTGAIVGAPTPWGPVAVLQDAGTNQFFTSGAISADTALLSRSGGGESPGVVVVLVSDVDGDGIRDGRDPCPRDPDNNVEGGCQRLSEAYPVVDYWLEQGEVAASTDGKRQTITATFTNISSTPVKNPFFEVTSLNGRNLLLNADGGAGGAGATLSPDVGDGVLSPGESMTVQFVIALRSRGPLQFDVTVRGEPGP